MRAVVSAADEVIAAIDGKEVACVLAIKCPEDTPGERTSGAYSRGADKATLMQRVVVHISAS